MRSQPDHPTELLALWHQLPAGDQHRLLSFARAMVEQRTGKRAARAARHRAN